MGQPCWSWWLGCLHAGKIKEVGKRRRPMRRIATFCAIFLFGSITGCLEPKLEVGVNDEGEGTRFRVKFDLTAMEEYGLYGTLPEKVFDYSELPQEDGSGGGGLRLSYSWSNPESDLISHDGILDDNHLEGKVYSPRYTDTLRGRCWEGEIIIRDRFGSKRMTIDMSKASITTTDGVFVTIVENRLRACLP